VRTGYLFVDAGQRFADIFGRMAADVSEIGHALSFLCNEAEGLAVKP
jgi:hypothetical protein